MDPKLWYWSAALANLGVIAYCGARALRAIRAGDLARHRRLMLAASALVALFLVSYLGKVVWLGREDRSAWSALDFAVLYFHELCIAAMLLAGGLALFRAWRFGAHLGPGPSLPPAPDSLPGRDSHRRAGRIAIRAGALALISAVGVWLGMLWRSG